MKAGDIVAGKFRVERVLGEGGMGIVVAASHMQLGQMVALKCMRPEVISPSYTKRFMREARAAVKLKSQHAARVLDVGEFENGSPYIVMEYLEGQDLSQLLHERGRIPIPEAVEYILQACEAIGEAHSHGIVHRDIKPANLFLTHGPSGQGIIKVLDFGVSKLLDANAQSVETNPGGRVRTDRPRPPPRPQDSVVTRATDLLGSPSYMAPEQILNASAADARSDIWSLGIILFKLVCGRGPFLAESLGELVQQVMRNRIPTLAELLPDCPPGFSEVVARCLERDRVRRYADVPELARALAPYSSFAAPSLERAAILGPSFSYAPAQPRMAAPPSAMPLGVAGAQMPQDHLAPSSSFRRPMQPSYAEVSPPAEPPRYGLVVVTGALAVAAFVAAAFLAMHAPGPAQAPRPVPAASSPAPLAPSPPSPPAPSSPPALPPPPPAKLPLAPSVVSPPLGGPVLLSPLVPPAPSPPPSGAPSGAPSSGR